MIFVCLICCKRRTSLCRIFLKVGRLMHSTWCRLMILTAKNWPLRLSYASFTLQTKQICYYTIGMARLDALSVTEALRRGLSACKVSALATPWSASSRISSLHTRMRKKLHLVRSVNLPFNFKSTLTVGERYAVWEASRVKVRA